MSVPPGRTPTVPPPGGPVSSIPGKGGVSGWLKEHGGLLGSVVGGALGYLSTRASNARQAAEAQKDRDFQERMSSTSHEREVRDLIAAGLNPILSANHGASTPGGAQARVEDAGAGAARGIATALAIKQAQAQIELTRAQADREGSSAVLARTQAYDLQTQGASGRYDIISLERDLKNLDLEQKRDLLPTVLARAKEELRLTSGTADRARLEAELDRLSIEGAKNLEAFQKKMGPAGPWVELFMRMLREGASLGRDIAITGRYR